MHNVVIEDCFLCLTGKVALKWDIPIRLIVWVSLPISFERVMKPNVAFCYFCDLLSLLDIIFFFFGLGFCILCVLWKYLPYNTLSQASNNVITSLPEDLLNFSKMTKLDVEVFVRSIIWVLEDGLFACSYIVK